MVFLPGQEDIESLTQLLQENLPTIQSYFAKHHILPDRNTSAGQNEPSGEIEAGRKEGKRAETGEDDLNLPNANNNITLEEDGSKTITIQNLYDFEIRPLYASMPPEEQLKVFHPAPKGIRKFILSTNIAETSVTISGVKYGNFFAFRLTDSDLNRFFVTCCVS